MTDSTKQHDAKPRALTLGIEMSNPSASGDRQRAHSVAFFDADDGLIGSAPLPDSSRGADAVMHAVDTLARSCSLEPSAVGRVLVSVGPGGYTALRIATTCAKMLAYALGASVVPVPAARVASVSLRAEDLPALIALASKRRHAHAELVGEGGTPQPIGIIDEEALGALGVRTLVCDAHLPASMRERAGELGLSVLPITLDARLLAEAARGLSPVEPDALAPIYAREPDAVTQWRARSSR